jgi:hypothetical protein
VGGVVIAYLVLQILRAIAENRRPRPPPEKWSVGGITEATLATYCGADWSKPTLLAVQGVLYDVSQSPELYGQGEWGGVGVGGWAAGGGGGVTGCAEQLCVCMRAGAGRGLAGPGNQHVGASAPVPHCESRPSTHAPTQPPPPVGLTCCLPPAAAAAAAATRVPRPPLNTTHKASCQASLAVTRSTLAASVRVRWPRAPSRCRTAVLTCRAAARRSWRGCSRRRSTYGPRTTKWARCVLCVGESEGQAACVCAPGCGVVPCMPPTS